jgi:hypothetical protein
LGQISAKVIGRDYEIQPVVTRFEDSLLNRA